MTLDAQIPLSKHYQIRHADILHIENSLLARLKARDFRLELCKYGKDWYLSGYHHDSDVKRIEIPIEEVKQGRGGAMPTYRLGKFFTANLSVNFSREVLQKEVEEAISIYSRLKLE